MLEIFRGAVIGSEGVSCTCVRGSDSRVPRSVAGDPSGKPFVVFPLLSGLNESSGAVSRRTLMCVSSCVDHMQLTQPMRVCLNVLYSVFCCRVH